jgi:hypothetical protein
MWEGRAMLQKLTEEIAECYRHARECHERANQSPDPATKEDFFDMERRWLFLARNYEFAERLSRFTTEAQRHKKRAEHGTAGSVAPVAPKSSSP